VEGARAAPVTKSLQATSASPYTRFPRFLTSQRPDKAEARFSIFLV
jgi:hypothetical protein